MSLKIKFSADRFKRGLVIRRAKKGIDDFFAPFKPAHIQKLLDTDRDLSTLIPQHKIAEMQARAADYKWAADMLSDGDIVLMIPPWIRDIISKHPNGPKWLSRQLSVLRSIFGGE